MNKKIVLFVCFFGIIINLYAEAPELRNVMPNSWQKVTKLAAAEEQAFAREHSAVFAETKDFLLNKWDLGWGDGRKYEHCSIYKQQVGTDTFYRVLWSLNVKPDFLSPNISFYQILLYKGIEVGSAPYYSTTATQYGDMGTFCSLDIIPGKEKAKGILYTKVSIERNRIRDNSNANEWNRGAPRIKGQLFGGVEGLYYLMEEALKKAAGKEHSVIQIDASSCLVDPNIPLRYGLQNAFDGDPSTSYVENTENDFIRINLQYARYREIRQIAIINGYAKDINLYIKNNRVKEITTETYQLNKALTEVEKTIFVKMICKDNTLDYQYFAIELPPAFLNITDVFRGSMYNDTCIAELNFRTDNGWLFGDIDE